jgi:hypothetical protein
LYHVEESTVEGVKRGGGGGIEVGYFMQRPVRVIVETGAHELRGDKSPANRERESPQ